MRKLHLILVVLFAVGSAYADEPKKDEPKKDEKKVEPKKDEPKKPDDKKPEDKPAAPPAASGASADVKAGTGIDKAQLTGEGTTFSKDTVVWGWSRVLNGEPSVKHVWKLDGKEVWSMSLTIPAKNYATFTRHTVRTAGNWTVEVTTESGESLGKIDFTVN